MTAADIVPFDAIAVEVVEHGKAVLVAVTVIGLRASVASSVGPINSLHAGPIGPDPA